MNLQTRARNVDLDPDLLAHVERTLRFALGPLASRVRRVVVQLVDQNGPRGGLDTRCDVRATLQRGGPLLAVATSSDAYRAVALAGDRVARRLVRSVKRQRQKRHSRR